MLYIIIAILAVIVLWNVIPAFREKLRGYSTVVEGIIGFIMIAPGYLADALQEATAVGMVPDGADNYISAYVFIWIIIKRFITETPVGKKY
jgi:hypothetical protein